MSTPTTLPHGKFKNTPIDKLPFREALIPYVRNFKLSKDIRIALWLRLSAEDCPYDLKNQLAWFETKYQQMSYEELEIACRRRLKNAA